MSLEKKICPWCGDEVSPTPYSTKIESIGQVTWLHSNCWTNIWHLAVKLHDLAKTIQEVQV